MNWFSNLFASRRELKRLVAERNLWRDKVTILEAENKKWAERCFATYRFCFDRFLTGVVKTPAVGDAIEQSLIPPPTAKDREDELKQYLAIKRDKLVEQAIEAGFSEADAEKRFDQYRPSYIEEFQQMFNN